MDHRPFQASHLTSQPPGRSVPTSPLSPEWEAAEAAQPRHWRFHHLLQMRQAQSRPQLLLRAPLGREISASPGQSGRSEAGRGSRAGLGPVTTVSVTAGEAHSELPTCLSPGALTARGISECAPCRPVANGRRHNRQIVS